MTIRDLIAQLQAMPPDTEVVAGEWVSPSQLGQPKLELAGDSHTEVPRLHIYCPDFYQQTDEEQAVAGGERGVGGCDVGVRVIEITLCIVAVASGVAARTNVCVSVLWALAMLALLCLLTDTEACTASTPRSTKRRS